MTVIDEAKSVSAVVSHWERRENHLQSEQDLGRILVYNVCIDGIIVFAMYSRFIVESARLVAAAGDPLGRVTFGLGSQLESENVGLT